MSFTGDLEHLPVVDVIQLLHTARKSGTLVLKSKKGESQLVFDEGFIVSANHVNNAIRIGHILTEMKVITSADIDQAVAAQKRAGADRKPLVATLIESGRLKKEDAFKGLEILIEMTIVEVLTWTTGIFALDIGKTALSDEYRYFPENLHKAIHLNTQGVLMDALRIFDEKTRDGSLNKGAFPEEPSAPEGAGGAEAGAPDISADILGLDNLDTIKKKVPRVFIGLKDYDPSETHRKAIREGLSELPLADQEKLFEFLMRFSKMPGPGEHRAHGVKAPTIIVFSRDEFLKHAVATVCKPDGLIVFTTDDEANIDMIVDQSLSKEQQPVLVIAPPAGAEGVFSEEGLAGLLAQKLAKYPQLCLVPLVAPGAWRYSLRVLQAGARAVLPLPGTEGPKEQLAENTITFLEAFRGFLKGSFLSNNRAEEHRFRESVFALGGLAGAPEVSLVLLRYAAEQFERALTLIVGKGELIAERGFGIKAAKGAGPTEPLRFRIPLAASSVFQEVIEKGELFFGESTDATLRKHLFSEIDQPQNPKILLLPLRSLGKVIGLIYADFGATAGAPVRIDRLEILARHAGLVLENAVYRKRFDKASTAQ